MTDTAAPTDEMVEVQASDLSLMERANALVDDPSRVASYGVRHEATTLIEAIRFLGGGYHEIHSGSGASPRDRVSGVRFFRLGRDVLITG